MPSRKWILKLFLENFEPFTCWLQSFQQQVEHIAASVVRVAFLFECGKVGYRQLSSVCICVIDIRRDQDDRNHKVAVLDGVFGDGIPMDYLISFFNSGGYSFQVRLPKVRK
jgi:hypothetical protein